MQVRDISGEPPRLNGTTSHYEAGLQAKSSRRGVHIEVRSSCHFSFHFFLYVFHPVRFPLGRVSLDSAPSILRAPYASHLLPGAIHSNSTGYFIFTVSSDNRKKGARDFMVGGLR